MRRIAASLILAGLLFAAPSASATYPGRNGDLVAVVTGDKYPDSPYLMTPVSPSGTRGTDSVICQPDLCGGISDAAVAPDGRRIAVVSYEKQPGGTEYSPS